VEEILKRVRRLEILTRRTVQELFSGEYHSRFKGQGLDFAEVRQYQPGDSYREIDWNVSARMGSPYVKKFEETRELNVLLLVDVSASTIFGTRTALKSELMAEIAAVLSFSALSNQDKVGLLLFTDRVETFVPPRKGKKTALRILRDILYFQPQGRGTDLKLALETAYRTVKRHSVIFVISDFPEGAYDDALRVLARKHDVTALRITDPAESDLPVSGLLHLEDPETGATAIVNTDSPGFRRRLRALLAARTENLRKRFRAMRVDLVELRTDQPYVPELMRHFRQKSRRRAA
jgi:uncharacterized protein (DUF58 family)